MNNFKNNNLVLVAHPDDETLSFSSICEGADVVAVTDGNWKGRGICREDEFLAACKRLGARKAIMFKLADIYPWSLPHEQIINQLRKLGPYDQVFTHSPFDNHPHHRNVVLAASCVFGNVWVEAIGSRPSQVHVLDELAFNRKIEILNSIYFNEIRAKDDSYEMSNSALKSVEAFSYASFKEIVHSLALTQPEIRADFPDVWCFDSSAYEQERFSLTCSLIKSQNEHDIKKIIEVGACEGAMTAQLTKAFPSTPIYAIEPHPTYFDLLNKRVGHERYVKTINASIADVDLDADLVLIAEMLYYVSNQTYSILHKINSKYLVTSYFGVFDDRIMKCLETLGWEQLQCSLLHPRFEAVDGKSSSLFIRRAGTNIRLWGRK